MNYLNQNSCVCAVWSSLLQMRTAMLQEHLHSFALFPKFRLLHVAQELAGDFGYFQMDWRELGVPRRGGVIVESFNSDEVMPRRWYIS
jgi:hypothetical protein